MKHRIHLLVLLIIALPVLAFAGGGAESPADDHGHDEDHDEAHELSAIPDVEQLASAGERLQTAASTTIVGDVLRNVAGDAADVTVLMAVGQNPHSYEPQPSDLRTLEEVDLVFTNGLGLEEDLLDDVDRMARGPVVPLSAEIDALDSDDHDDDHGQEAEDDHDHAVDPHVWMDPNNVIVWVDTIERVLSAADPANASTYETNAGRYREQLREIDRFIRNEVESIPLSRRKLVLDHKAYSYFAEEYGFETVGTIVPGTSDNAEPSAQEVARLVELIREEDVRAIFVGRTASRSMERLARTIADEVGRPVEILPTLTGSLSAPGEPGDTYLGFVRYNVEQILTGLGR
ncbi:MAG: metal ABC transporter substrate-binding protein [Spirochaetota bacterium]